MHSDVWRYTVARAALLEICESTGAPRPDMHMGRASGTNVYSGLGVSRDVYERMGAWAAFTDSKDNTRNVVRYEREDCGELARVCATELARLDVGPRCCGAGAPSAAPRLAALGGGRQDGKLRSVF